ncbi:hypothetical protein SAMN04489761_1024 [Tenacibaculum sp. MAR_2009_124]|uniref:hypothetical protein n=1 Tax=Tenacibaculum sp. MAR_2009_124 TaxID=1250059 RepID=UPI0008978C43|nr:hypothetical protein [Tenacibaculum sp. MAR_2009_124]SEB49277.1 hypothetical protein SAMN04489761_1024 [Tenacibaculum sp. MAR_2009_124]
MKNLIKLTLLCLIISFASCSEESNINAPDSYEKGIDKEVIETTTRGIQTSCNVYSTTNVKNCRNSIETFRVSTDLPNAMFSWSVSSAQMSIIGASSGQTVTIKYGSNFTGGNLRVDITSNAPNSNVQCDDILYLPYQNCTYDPCSIYPSAYIQETIPACYPASHPYGRYNLANYSGPSNNVTWSVNYGTVLLDSGAVQVHVAAASLHPFTLTATIKEGNCTKKVSKVIYPCDSGGGGFGK